MDLITLDFETYYASDFSLSNKDMTTEAYVRDSRFETILCGFSVNRAPAYWVPAPDVPAELDRLRIEDNAVLCHHAHFDGLILSHHYRRYPRVWFDTLSMARAVFGSKGGNSLAKLAERLGIGRKGEEVLNAKGKRLRDFSPAELARYGGYCGNDVWLTHEVFDRLLQHFPKSELKIIDMVVRMFTEPVLRLDAGLLIEYAQDLRADKVGALMQAGIALPDVMSNDKFALALERLGVAPPTKISPTTGKETWAFAKTDKGMEALAEHPDERVQLLVAARLKNKTTIAETRAMRMIGMSGRGAAPIYLNYSGAGQTHRLSGGDKMNWQNMGRGGKLRDAVMAEDDKVSVVCDSSNIESRVLDWLAMQMDAVEVYRKYDAGQGPDTYCVLAEKIYSRPITKADNPDERQMGKIAKLGLGYGMGGPKFCGAVRVQTKGKVLIHDEEGRMVVSVYRSSHPEVVRLWRRAEDALGYIAKGVEGVAVDPRGVVVTCDEGLLLPNGLKIKYPELRHDGAEGWTYFNGRSREKIYGGKIVENIVQALARIVVLDQTLAIHKYLPVVHSVHDEAVSVTDADDGKDAASFAVEQMRIPPAWGPDLPLNAESGFHQRYGRAKK
jgi:DNA polymerase